MEPFSFGPSNSADRFDYLLYCRAVCSDGLSGRWQFALENSVGETVLEAEDQDDGDLNRLTLWALVRGLEAVDGESSITLLSSNRYVIRSLTDHLPRWRENQFVWEHFGRYTEVQNGDLWRRVDRALRIHRVEACLVQPRLVSDGRSADPTSEARTSNSLGSRDSVLSGDSIDPDGPILRADRPHAAGAGLDTGNRDAGPSAAPVPPRRSRGSRPMADPLRRFLLSSAESVRARHGRRFTAADLAGN